MIRNLISNLIFLGYPKEEYEYKHNVELRGAINAFKAQIKFVTILSFTVLAFDSIAILATIALQPIKKFLTMTSVHIEMMICIVAIALTFLGIRYKIACICLSVVYFIASVLLIIFGNAGSLFCCVVCGLCYVRVFFSHLHIEYAQKNMDTDEHAEMRSVIKGTNDNRLDLKEVFSQYEKGGVNPFSGRVNHEAVFDMPLEEEKQEEETDINKCFTQKELDALLSESQPKKAEHLFDEAN